MLRSSLWALGGATLGGSLLQACQAQPPQPSAASTGRARRPIAAPDTSRAVQRVVAGVRKREGAGFLVRRPFPTRQLDLLDPFLLLDEMGPSAYGPGEAVGAPDHPHRGFETVTYMLDGRLHHRDSMGHDGSIGRGGVQWMTAGSGIVHSEMPTERILAEGGRMHGFQLWVNLPRDLKMMRPHYQELQAEAVPVLETDDGRASGRIVAGEALGVGGGVQTTVPTTYQHWSLQGGAVVDLPLPNAQRVGAFVFDGEARLGADTQRVEAGALAIFGEGEAVRLGTAPGKRAELLLMAAAPLGEPVARYGPFVMNTDAEIRQAFSDYRAGRMGRIPPG